MSYDLGPGYYAISDDRSAKNPARFYTVRIAFADNRLTVSSACHHRAARYVPVNHFRRCRPRQASGDPAGSRGHRIRRAPRQLYWSSEGERDGALIRDPSVRIATVDGGYVGEFALPPMLRMSYGTDRSRQNRGLEGLTLAPSGRLPVGGDGGPGLQRRQHADENAGALTRVTRFDVETRTATAQYAYPLDKVGSGPQGDNGLTDRGPRRRELPVPRTGLRHPRSSGIYRVSVGDAEDVLARPSLTETPARTMRKTLLVDLRAPTISWTTWRESHWAPSCRRRQSWCWSATTTSRRARSRSSWHSLVRAISACRVALTVPSTEPPVDDRGELAVRGRGRVRQKAAQHADGLVSACRSVASRRSRYGSRPRRGLVAPASASRRPWVDRISTARASPGSTARDTSPASSSLRTWVVIVGCEQ